MQKVQNIVTGTAKFASHVFSSKTSSSQGKKGKLFTHTVHCVHEIKTKYLLLRRHTTILGLKIRQEFLLRASQRMTEWTMTSTGLSRSPRDVLCNRETNSSRFAWDLLSFSTESLASQEPFSPRHTEIGWSPYLWVKGQSKLTWAKVLRNCVYSRLFLESLSITHQAGV